MTRSVLQVNTSDTGGGAESVALELHRRYRSRGIDAWLAVGFPRTGEEGVLALGRGRSRRRRVLSDPAVLLDVARGHEDFRFPVSHGTLELPPKVPDVLHLHNLHGGYFDLRALPALSARVPVVVTLHDAWLLTGHCAHPFDCERWLEACGECPYLDTYPPLLRDGTAFNLARKRALYAKSSITAVTPSRWLMEMVERSVLSAAATRAVVIPNGIDLAVFSPGDREEARRALGVRAGAKLVVFAAEGGRANEFRDMSMLERALERLATGSLEVEVVVLGDTDPRSGRHGRWPVNSVGRVEAREVAQWLRAADVYVHPSRADTFPNGVLEALACGTPVIASSVGGIPEQIGEGGVLVPPGDDAQLAHELELMLTDPARRDGMGATAAAEARMRFDAERQVNAYLELYDELC